MIKDAVKIIEKEYKTGSWRAADDIFKIILNIIFIKYSNLQLKKVYVLH